MGEETLLSWEWGPNALPYPHNYNSTHYDGSRALIIYSSLLSISILQYNRHMAGRPSRPSWAVSRLGLFFTPRLGHSLGRSPAPKHLAWLGIGKPTKSLTPNSNLMIDVMA